MVSLHESIELDETSLLKIWIEVEKKKKKNKKKSTKVVSKRSKSK